MSLGETFIYLTEKQPDEKEIISDFKSCLSEYRSYATYLDGLDVEQQFKVGDEVAKAAPKDSKKKP